MLVIPVMDLKDGVVVHARKGERANYQPIASSLCEGSKPSDILNALLKLYPFPILYIADLDAIQGHRHHLSCIQALLNEHTKLEIWIDAGIHSIAELHTWQHPRLRPVLGTESLANLATWQQLDQACQGNQVLSLDFTIDGYQGPMELLNHSKYWPKDVIVMSLPHVGSHAGPNFTLLQSLQQQHLKHHFYAAGGTRAYEDIEILAAQGIKGTLIASALHNGSITSTMLHTIMKTN